MTDRIQILLDLNALGYTAHHHDPKVNGSGMQVQAVEGILLTIRDIKIQFPLANLIGLWDGVSWRKDVLKTYKENRDAKLEDFDTTKPMDEATQKKYKQAVAKASVRAAYKKQSPYIARALSALGIPQATCFNYEADDLAALFSDRYVEKGYPVRLVTTDGDWLQLVRNRVVWKSHRAPFTFINSMNFEEKVGFKTPELFVQSKILDGDKGDDVPGIPGFGDKCIERFFATFPGGFDEFFSLPSDFIEGAWNRVTSKKAPKCVNELHEKGEKNPALVLNRTLVDLRTKDRPAPSSLKIDKGEMNPGALMGIVKELDLYNLSSDLARFMDAFKEAA